ncbi:MAG: glycosyltransferase family 2 protein [Burkholderiaceae bacterium]|nr:glycosyltransferase family 2 protein [Burkholderiaceae bacterium]
MPLCPPYFSLILATVDRIDELGRLLDTLERQTDRSFELIVVDQNADDRVAPYVKRATDADIPTTHVRSARRGLSHARNLGLGLARGEVVAFPDDDCWYEVDVLAQARLQLEGAECVDGVVGRWHEEDPDRQRLPHRLSFETWHALRGGDASSICLFLRRALVERLGRFDDRLGAGAYWAAGEETDLVLRALRDGAVLRFVPEIGVHHARALPPSRWDQRAFRDTLRRARGTGAIYAKHRMSAWVVLRGTVSPVIKGLCSRNPLVRGVHGLYGSVGRLYGMLSWRNRDDRARA